MELRIAWVAADGTTTGYTSAAQNAAVSASSTNPDQWPRLRVAGAAPASTVAAAIHLRKLDTNSGQTDSYMFVSKPMLCRVPAGAGEPTPWSDGGVVMITNGGIVANAVTADNIAANAITAGKIGANAVTAGTIAAGAVTAATIAAGTITGDKLAANTIGANQIAANAITAKQLVLTDFSNMADNGWQTGTLDGWVTQNVERFYNDNSGGDAAGYFLQSLGRDCARSSFVAVTPGETYAFDVWVYNKDAALASILAMTQTPPGDPSWYFVAGTNDKNGWVRLQGRFVVPSGASKLAMLLQLDKTAGTGSSCFWSKPVMRRAVSAELIVDGAITANKIAVNSLDAISANIGSLQVGRSNIQSGAVSRVDYDALGQAGIGTNYGAITGLTAWHGQGAAAVIVHSAFSLSGTGPIVNGVEQPVKITVAIWDSANNGYTATIDVNFMGKTHFAHEFNFTPPGNSTSTQFRFDVRVTSGSNVTANNRTIRRLSLYGR